MTCKACMLPVSGVYITTCRQCSLRKIARDIPFADSIRDNQPTEAYRRQLAALGKPTAVHREVLAMAEKLKAGV